MRISWLPVAALTVVCSGCSREAMPSVQSAARRFALAAREGDSAVVYQMLAKRSRAELGKAGTERLVVENRAELRRLAASLDGSPLAVRARAEVPLADGDTAVLELERGRFWVAAAGGLPRPSRTPAEAVSQLRHALKRKSYPRLLRALTRSARAELEQHLGSLVEGLEHPETLPVQIRGDRATVSVPGGHLVRLRKEHGIWRVEDFQ